MNLGTPFIHTLFFNLIGPIQQSCNISSNVAELGERKSLKNNFLILDAIKLGCILYMEAASM